MSLKATPASRSLHPALALRLALRQLRRAPGTAFYAALTLAVGLGAATAIYSVMQGFNAPLPVPGGKGVVQVKVLDPENGRNVVSIEEFLLWKEESRVLERPAAFSTFQAAVVSEGRATRRISGATLSEDGLAVLGVQPFLGRLPTASLEDESGVLLSWELWKEWLDGDPEVLGKALHFDEKTYIVVGVLEKGIHFPFRENLWRVSRVDAADAAWQGVEVFGRLAEGVGRRQAGEELTALLKASRSAQGAEANTARVEIYGFTEERGEGGELTMLFGMLILVFALVLVSCSNVSNLLLENAIARSRMLSLYQALGASPGQIVLQIFTEALLIAVLAALLGILVAFGVVSFVESTLAGNWGYFWMRVRLEPSAAVFAAFLAVLTALVSGILPIRRTLNTDLVEPLKQESTSGSAADRGWTARFLLTGQVAFSCVGVIAAVLLGFGLLESRRVLEDFPADSVLWTSLTFDASRYEQAEVREGFRQTLLQDLEQRESIRFGALSTGLPGLRSPTREVLVDGFRLREDRPLLSAEVTPKFFDVFNLPLVEGRAFREGESDDVAIVSEDFVRNRLEGEEALGRRIEIRERGKEPREARIVGVVKNVEIYEADRRRDLDYLYLPLTDAPARQLYLVVRAAAERPAVLADLRDAALRSDPEVAFDRVQSMTEILAYVRQFMETLGILAVLGGLGAVVVVTIGLYGLISFEVRRRLREFALRLALGASLQSVALAVFRKAFLLVAPGCFLGLALTWWVTPLLGVFLGGRSAHDPAIFLGALAVYAGITFLAAVGPAWRAASCHPADILRDE